MDNDAYEDDEQTSYDSWALRDEDALRSMKMKNKIPPAFDGRVQTIGCFAYEESVEEWESMTTIEPRLR